ncbi:hypothetical protein Q5P01_000920 [Channa striata]|uniref:Uncharacterized protein n=1 Tax=Channa striata TaxID=64152 RepID=A0AA88LMW3_CHASR|nr:hypothetical protein Q5P01_000920 [Channa striata]
MRARGLDPFLASRCPAAPVDERHWRRRSVPPGESGSRRARNAGIASEERAARAPVVEQPCPVSARRGSSGWAIPQHDTRAAACPYLKANYTAGVSRLRSGSEVRQGLVAHPKPSGFQRLESSRTRELSRGIVALTGGPPRTNGTFGTRRRVLNLRREAKSARSSSSFGPARVSSSGPSELTVRGSSSRACVLGRGVRFRRDRTPCSVALDSAVSRADLLRCLARQRAFSALASWSTASGAARKARTAARLRSALLLNRLGEGDARENATSRTTRRFSIALSGCTTRPARARLPGEKEVADPGLARSGAEEPRPFTALLWWVRSRFFLEVELPGRDAARTPSGGGEPTGVAPRRRSGRGGEQRARREGAGRRAAVGDLGRPSAEADRDRAGNTLRWRRRAAAKKRGGGKKLGEKGARSLALFGEAAPSRNYTYHEFNNLAGTLTGGPKAFPYAFTVRRRRVNFSDSELLPEPRRPRGPFACLRAVGLDQPVLLMEDPWTGTPASECSCREAREQAEPGRGPQVLSGLQREVLQRGGSFDQNLGIPGPGVQRGRGHCESLLRLAKVSAQRARGSGDLANLGDSLGKIAVYQRAAVSKPKLSMRLLWYLPTELCSFEGIEAYRPLLEEIEKASLGYTLLVPSRGLALRAVRAERLDRSRGETSVLGS